MTKQKALEWFWTILIAGLAVYAIWYMVTYEKPAEGQELATPSVSSSQPADVNSPAALDAWRWWENDDFSTAPAPKDAGDIWEYTSTREGYPEVVLLYDQTYLFIWEKGLRVESPRLDTLLAVCKIDRTDIWVVNPKKLRKRLRFGAVPPMGYRVSATITVVAEELEDGTLRTSCPRAFLDILRKPKS